MHSVLVGASFENRFQDSITIWKLYKVFQKQAIGILATDMNASYMNTILWNFKQ